MKNILDDLRFAVTNITSGAAFTSNPVEKASLLGGAYGVTDNFSLSSMAKQFDADNKANNTQAVSAPTSSGGSGSKGAQAIAAKEGELSTFDVMSVMPILSNQVGKSGSTYYELLEGGGNIEARVGRRDGEPYLYMVDDSGTIREVLRVESNQVEGLKKQAAIINALNQSAKVEDVSDANANADAADDDDDDDDDDTNVTKKLDSELNLNPTDNTAESVEATTKVEDAYKEVVEIAENTFGTGDAVAISGGFNPGKPITMTGSPEGAFTTEDILKATVGIGPAYEVYDIDGNERVTSNDALMYQRALDAAGITVSLGSENEGAGLGGGPEQLESSFSDNEIRLQQELEAAQAALTTSESTVDTKNDELLALTEKITDLENLLTESSTALESSTKTIDDLNEALANANSAEQIQAIYDEQFAKASEAVTADLQAQYDKALAEAIAAAQAELGATAGQASTTVATQPGNAAEVVINPGDALSSVPVEQQTYSSNTLTGGEKQQEASTSVGPAEDAAIDLYTSGVRGTILTTPGGLLTNLDDENLRTARGLIQ